MTDISQETPTVRKISVSYERKQDLGDYSNEVARAWVENTIPADADPAAVAQEMAELFAAAKAAVYDELAIEYTMTDAGMIVETPSVKAVTTNVTRAFAPSQPQERSSGTIRVMNADEAANNGPLPEWLVAECNKLGITAVWDRRATADPSRNQASFQEAVGNGKQGHGKDGKAKGFWPPK